MSESKPKISPAPNGPLIVEGLTELRTADGAIECQPKVALCRCGQSANKPFCDGAHAATDFSSAKADGRAEDRVDDYVGKEITIHDNRSICAHAGSCTDGLPSVWRIKQEPWIDAGAATPEEIIAIVNSCPSGALSYTLRDGSMSDVDESLAPGATVFVAKGGPYAFSGEVELTGEAFGSGAQEQRITLCRCGASKNKPFCDGTHWNVSFDV